MAEGRPKYSPEFRRKLVELVEAGANVLAGSDNAAIIAAFDALCPVAVTGSNLYGDGQSAPRILAVLAQ